MKKLLDAAEKKAGELAESEAALVQNNMSIKRSNINFSTSSFLQLEERTSSSSSSSTGAQVLGRTSAGVTSGASEAATAAMEYDDPMEQVRQSIVVMIRRLQAQNNGDATHGQWCKDQRAASEKALEVKKKELEKVLILELSSSGSASTKFSEKSSIREI